MLSIRLPEALEQQLATLAKETKRSKSHYVKEALERYLEDHYDIKIALERLNDKDAEYISLAEMRKRLGLDG
jgi:RHH-type transcriptional regulator, rel operon repressor / antitoxin RelB